MRVNIKNLPNGYKIAKGKVIKTMALGGIPRTQANLEAEKGETALTDLDNDGVHELYTIGGERHSNGGTPLNLPPQSFIFSDTAKMKFDKTELAELGIESTKKRTPAWVSKKHPLNKFIHGGADEHKDSISDETSELMLQKNKLQLSKIAFMQEAKKEFLDEEGNVHVPLAAYPFLISKGVNPEEFVAKLEEINNQKQEAQSQQGQEGMPPQGMPPQGMPPQGPPQGGMPPEMMQQMMAQQGALQGGMPPQGPPQGGPMHQMPDGSMMPGASHGEPQQRQQGGGGDIEELMQQIAQALQQGAQPEEIMQQLVQMGMPEEQAMQILQQTIQGVQGQQGPQQGPPMMKSGGDVPCLSCGGPMMGHGGDPFSNNPLNQFVYGGEDYLPQYEGRGEVDEVDDTFSNTLAGDDWSSVRELWYASYVDAATKYNESSEGAANPLIIPEKEEAFKGFYKFNEMQNTAEVKNINYNPGCEIKADGSRPATDANGKKCDHNNPAGDLSYKRQKDAGLIPADMTVEQYNAETRQFQAMYRALGSVQYGPNTSDADKALLAGLEMNTSREDAWNMTQNGFNISNIDSKNGVLTASSHVGIADAPSEIIEQGDPCPDAVTKQAECTARNSGGSVTPPLNAPNPVGDPIETPVNTPNNPIVNDDDLQTAQAGVEVKTSGAWTWDAVNCQCVQETGGFTPNKNDFSYWTQDNMNVNNAYNVAGMRDNQWPIMQKLGYNDANIYSHDPLSQMHASNAAAGTLGENATHAQRMELMGEVGNQHGEAVTRTATDDIAAYNTAGSNNSLRRGAVDEKNSGYQKDYVDGVNTTLANDIVERQQHADNINNVTRDRLTNAVNTYNNNPNYPNFNINPGLGGLAQFTGGNNVVPEQNNGSGNPMADEYNRLKNDPNFNHLTDKQLIKLSQQQSGAGGGNNQIPGYPGSTKTAKTVKYGAEMRDLQANRKALRKWILGIQ